MSENRPNRSFDFFTRKWTFLVILCVAPTYILFACFGDPGRGLTAYVSLAMITVAIRYFWDLRHRLWFWVTVAFIALMHILGILFFRFPDKHWNQVQHWNYIQLLPFGLLDFAVVYGIIRLAESVIGGWPTFTFL